MFFSFLLFYHYEKGVNSLTMLNQTSTEALLSATYVENYLDCVENLPNDLQRHLSRMRELDVTYRGNFPITTCPVSLNYSNKIFTVVYVIYN